MFAGFRFPREVIAVAVRWYLRYGLSYRYVEELLAERGTTVDHVTIYRWVQRFTPEFIEAARFCRHAPGNRWFADETYVKVAGRWTYLYRAIDQYGQVIDVMLSARRDLAAARRFFTRALRAGTVPAEVTTDQAPAYPRVLDELIPSALHTVEGTVALRHLCARQGRITRMLRWSDGGCQVVEGDAEPVAVGDVGGDVVVAAAQVLHEGVTGGEDPC